MKKILALALAILMVVSLVSLTACTKEGEEDPEDDYEYNGDGSGNGSDSGSGDGSDHLYNEPDDDEWITRTDYYVCVGIDGVALRKGPGVDYDMVAVLNANTKLKCTRTSDTWNEVIYDGMTYYVSAQYSGSAKDFEFDDYAAEAQVSLSVKAEKSINLRTTPFYSDSAKEFNVGINGFDATALNGKDAAENDVVESLKLIGKSKSGVWYKVSYTGSWKAANSEIKYYENAIFYLKGTPDVLSAVEGLPSTGVSSNGGVTHG